jgi:hypothetical protein
MKIDTILNQYKSAGLAAKIVDAPKDAVTFDKLIVVFSTPACKTIKMVSLYSEKEQKIVGQY